MDDRRHAAVVELLIVRVDADDALLQAPIAPGRDAVVHRAVGALDRDFAGQVEHVPDRLDPGPDRDDDLIALDRSPVRDDAGDRVGIAAALEARDLHAGHDAHAPGLRLAGQAIDGSGIVGIAALLLVQDGGDALRAPVGQQALHVGHAVLPALDEIGLVADRLLLLVDAGHILAHRLVADLHVADRVVAERLRIGFPDLDAVRHQLAHGGLEIIVAHHAAGNAAGPRGDRGLVEHQDVGPAAPAVALGCKAFGQPPRGGQAVDSRADDDIAGVFRETHRKPLDRG